MKLNIEELKDKMGNIETNLAIYKNDLLRYEKKIKKLYGVDKDDIDERPEEIEEEIAVLERKRRKLLKEIEEDLDDVDA